uniref:Slit homolog 3 (Drosophila) n=1 Tax=Salmo trutta TaxID=8032 RepID=A0A673YMP2_SALTR
MLPNVQEKWTAYHWGIWVLMCGLLCAAVVNGCPHKCSCSGSHVDCQGQGFRTVPKGIPRNAERLDLDRNNITRISKVDFSGIKNLRVLCAFKLPLTFHPCLYLMLPRDLSENQIQAVPRKAFRGITTVKNLQLDSNHISCIEDGAFRALRDLEILTLNNNNITLIPLSSFNHMPKLRTLRLHSNNLHCDCHLSWLSDWLRQRRGLALFTQCMAPANMRGLNIPDVQKKDFTCTGPAQAKPHTCIPQASVCPASCTCNNNIVDCRRKGLTEIPANLPEGIVEIRLEQNLIKNIPAGAFSPYKKLKRIDLSKNQVSDIAADAFTGLRSLTSLVLYGNKIAEIPKGLFDGLVSLQLLYGWYDWLEWLVMQLWLAGMAGNAGMVGMIGWYGWLAGMAGIAGMALDLNLMSKCAPCLAGPCLNNGTCASNVSGSYHCTCPFGYKGQNCEISINACISFPCANGGTCYVIPGQEDQFSCTCPPGYEGLQCEVNPDDCEDNDCENNSTCVDSINNYTCFCPPNFIGDLCEEGVDPCMQGFDPCQHDSKCLPLTKGYRCECLPGYVGQHCEQDYNDCLENKCQHGAECVDAVNGYTCVCKEGFSGLFCENPPPMILLQTSPCDQSECQNGAQCLVMAGEPVCRCLPGFTGNKCHKIVTVHLLGKDAYLELSSAKIRNSAHISLQVATDKDNGILLYKEDHDPLALELYQGHIRIIYDIANYPLTTVYSVESVNDGLFHTVELLIQNHSLSLVVDKGSPKRLGKLPRQPSVDHSPDRSPQAFNGCIHNVRINGELQDLGAAPRRVEGILPGCHSCSVCAQGACRQRGETGVSCECPPSHSGSLCHQKTAPSPCQSSRCIHGLCVPKASSYSCQCAEGYTGQYCDRREEPQACRGHQCRHGECRVPGSGEPSCHCQPGSGPACSEISYCEAVRELLKRQQPMNTCTSTSKIPRVECPRACDGGLCCAPSKTRRRKVVFKCTDGSSFSEEIEITLECGCAKCPL